MGRASKQIVIFLILLNSAAYVVTASGLGAALDINPELTGDEKVDETTAAASDIDPSQGAGDTLFTLFTSAATAVEGIFTLVFYGPAMLVNIGVPFFLTVFLGSAAAIIVGTDMLYVLTGRDV